MSSQATARKPEREFGLISRSYNEHVVSEEWKKHRSATYFEYRRKWAENPEKFLTTEYPLNLDIETTTLCNLACPMCERTLKMKNGTFRPVSHMSMDFYKRIITEAGKGGVAAIKLNYLGEPLLHPDVVEQVRFAKEQGIIDVMFNTNGTLLTRDTAKAVLDAGIDGIFISFDSPYKESFEKVRVGAKFEEVLQNAKDLYELRNSNPKYKHVFVRSNKVLFPTDSEELVRDYINLWKDRADVVGFTSYMDQMNKKAIGPTPGLYCDQPWQRMLIRQDGLAYPCCADIIQGYCLGDANKMSIKELWQGEMFRQLREKHSTGKCHEVGVCKVCPYLTSRKVKI